VLELELELALEPGLVERHYVTFGLVWSVFVLPPAIDLFSFSN